MGRSNDKIQDRYYTVKEYDNMSYEDKGELKKLRNKRNGGGSNKENSKRMKFDRGNTNFNDIKRQISALQSKLDGMEETGEEVPKKKPGILNNRTNNALTRQNRRKGGN